MGPDEGAETLLREAVANWVQERGAQGVARTTLTSQRDHVLALARTIARLEGCDLDELSLRALTPSRCAEAVEEYRFAPDRRYRESTGPSERSPGSVRVRVSALGNFAQWCVQAELLRTDPSARLRVGARSRRTSGSAAEEAGTSLTAEEAELVLAAARLSRAPERDTLVVALGSSVGLSLREIHHLQVGDRRDGLVRVRGRGGRVREVALSDLARRSWDAWLPVREALLERSGCQSSQLVCSLRSRPGPEGTPTIDTSYTGLGELCTRLLQVAGVDARGRRAHVLRATFAILALTSGSHTPGELRAQLGCRSVEALRPYLAASTEALQRAASAHPLGS